ncbi:MAG: ComF family protein [Gemmatimonadetes bacterium]|nr:ComF family protein [Gemmatimonadota bacterium]
MCQVLHPAIREARSWCWADDAVARALLHALKYDGWTAAAGVLAEAMRTIRPSGILSPSLCLLPVPLAPGRQRTRGYNQSELLAVHLARLWQCALVPDAIERLRETPSQTQLTRSDRFANVAGAFAVTAAGVSRLRGTCCVLVDDVMTTGATLNACAAALDAVGVEAIAAVTFGRARDPRATTPA